MHLQLIPDILKMTARSIKKNRCRYKQSYGNKRCNFVYLQSLSFSMKKVYLIFTAILLTACQTKKDGSNLTEKNLTNEEIIQIILSEDYKETLGIDEEGRALLYSFYEKRHFKPLWVSNGKMDAVGTELVHLLQQPVRFGISDRRFDLNWNEEHPIHNEIVIACGLARSYNDLRYGMLDSSLTKLKPISYVAPESLDTLLDFSRKNYAEKIISWGPPDDTIYHAFANTLFHFVQNNAMDEAKIELKTFREDSIASVSGTKAILLAKHYMDSTQTEDSAAFVSALKQFQSDHGCNPDGIIGVSTVRALTETNLHKAQRLAYALEKQRTRQPYPKQYIYINIPEFTLRLYNEDTLCTEHRIVVGKYENQTPELVSGLHSIVVYPYWSVPYSIASKEILPAAQKNPAYFERNNMVLLQKKDTIDPYKVNWKKITEKSFPYRVVQQPGHKNSLGILKFDFHNKFDVYFHDTPSKSLFNSVSRTYSHGCMRTEYPVDLAKYILELDENKITPDSLDSLISRTGINYHIRLKKRIPVFIEYNTVIIRNGETKMLRDIYLHDDRFLRILFKETTG